jgi:hypothetical protein
MIQSRLSGRGPFLTVCQVVLVLGNTLNGSSFRGGARGFQLDSLLKVCNITITLRNPADNNADNNIIVVEGNQDG